MITALPSPAGSGRGSLILHQEEEKAADFRMAVKWVQARLVLHVCRSYGDGDIDNRLWLAAVRS
jgi:hypothetical protein